ncbi:MAG: hypothetical protein M1827_002696 [Pycnora praestabilis]|nr:MAG: hypothetical protein M1827_002696 [Pycnora praestabilis]
MANLQHSTMDEQAPQARLLAVLRERDIPLTRDDVGWAFDSPQTNGQVTQWVQQYLGAETLLSKEELELYSRIAKTDVVRNISANHDLSIVRPIVEDEIRTAIASLEESTASIERQNISLKAQWEALKDLKDQSQHDETTRKRDTDRRCRKHLLEKQHMELAIEEHSAAVTSQMAELQQQNRHSNANLVLMVNELLERDDNILARLENLAADIKDTDINNAKAHRVDILCQKLSKFYSQELRCRLDRTFLENQLNSKPLEGVAAAAMKDEAEIKAVREELDSLYSEIASVAAMSVYQEFREPILQGIMEAERQVKADSESNMNHISSSMDHLANRMNILVEHVENQQAHRQALNEISTVIADEPNSHELETRIAGNASSPIKLDSPTRVAANQGDTSLLRSTVIRRESDPVEGFIDPDRQLLKLLGIPVLAGSKGETLEKTLPAVTADRKQKLVGHYEGLESFTDSALTSHFCDADQTLQLLLDTLYMDTKYHDIHLLDADLDASVDRLEAGVGKIAKALGELNLEILHAPDVKRERFLERWSH